MVEQVVNDSYISIVKNRVACANKAFEALDKADTLIKELQTMVSKCSTGESVDLETAAKTTHQLRDCIDQILVGIVESQLEPPFKR